MAIRDFDQYEDRLMAITKMAIEVKVLILDESTDEVSSAEDPAAERLVYASAFQTGADGKIEGSAEEIFEAIEEALDV
jgi:hypothetical protein